MTSRFPLVLALSTAVALTGCGGGSSKAGKPLTKEKAAAIAAAALLVDADLPGFTGKPQTHDASDDDADAQFATCTGVPKQTYLTRNYGTSFTKDALEVDSSVDVATTQKVAEDSLAAYTGSKAASCVETVFRGLITKEGGNITAFKATPSTVKVTGASKAFILKLDITATGGGQTIELHGFQAGALVNGQVEISVSTLDTGGTSFTQDQSVALLEKSVSRANKAA